MEQQQPTVSIIVVNYNGCHHLKNCLPSLLSQTYPAELLEVIVVDNGSIDDSVAYLETNYPMVKIIRNTKNEGFAKPNNQAAAIASGQYIALINNDMAAQPDWVEQLIQTHLRTQAECVAGTILNWDGTKVDFVNAGRNRLAGAYQIDYGKPISILEQYQEERRLLFACGGAMLVNRELYLKVGGFDEEFFAYYEDVDLGWRLTLQGYKVVLSPKAITLHRHNGTSRKMHRFKLKYISERNVLSMLYKNYSDENCAKYLCGTVMLWFVRVGELLRFDPVVLDIKHKPQGLTNKIRSLFVRLRTSLRILRKTDHILVLVAAVMDFIRQLPELREKRRKIQELRRCSDEDIMLLLGTPVSHFDNVDYQKKFDLIFQRWEM